MASSVSASLMNSDSRLVNEFEILDFIGKGAFGDVLKVSYRTCYLNILVMHIPDV